MLEKEGGREGGERETEGDRERYGCEKHQPVACHR